MRQKYTAQRMAVVDPNGSDWYVRENHSDGRTAQIMCFCRGEAAAKEIATALRVKDEVIDILAGDP